MDQLPSNCIAAEFNTIINSGKLTVGSDELHAKPKGCFDLAAARGLRGGRGRCACHCSCLTAADRHRVPVCLEGDDVSNVDWPTVAAELEAHTLLDNQTMRDDSHTPPNDWDFTAAPWTCKRPGCGVSFESKQQYHVQRAILFVLRKDTSATAKKERASRAAAYLLLHPSNQEEFNPPLTDLNMKDVLIDPLHDLQLNLPKTIWKYSFGDRMTMEQRELVADYLTSIGCPLDIRAKGDGRDANRKWFLGDVFQRFVEGDSKDNKPGINPGLMANITAILDIIYLKCPAPLLPAANPPANPPGNKTAKNGGGGAKIRKGGFSVAPPPLAASKASAPLPSLPPAEAESERLAKLRIRYGSHMDSVRLALDAWGAFGLLYVEWRTPWELKTDEYKQKRALMFAKCAAANSKAMKALSIGKHKSWYVHLTLWVIPLQIAEVGDLWPFSTGPVEQRGARLKRIAREVVSWRPPDDGFVNDANGKRHFVKRRKYDTCAMLQLLRACVAQEVEWDRPRLGGPDLSVSERRMLQRGRVSLIQEAPGWRLPVVKQEAEEIIDLTLE